MIRNSVPCRGGLLGACDGNATRSTWPTAKLNGARTLKDRIIR
jgi:hypothetical protein